MELAGFGGKNSKRTCAKCCSLAADSSESLVHSLVLERFGVELIMFVDHWRDAAHEDRKTMRTRLVAPLLQRVHLCLCVCG